jgi:hypothetical protein
MEFKRVSPSFIKTNNAVDGDFLVFNAANNSVEFTPGSNAWANANDYSTYTTLSGEFAANDYNTYTAIQSEFAANDYATYLAAQINDYATYTTLSGEFAANDYNSYTTLVGFINTVQDNVSAGGGGDASNAWVNANDYNTYTTLSGLIDTVQDNVSTVSSNTQVYVGDILLSNTTLRLTAGEGITISGNSASGEATFTVSMSNVTSQTIALDGSANSFSIVKAVSNTNMVFVIYNGLVQDPSRYSIDNTTLALANDEPIISGANLEIRYLDFFSSPGTSESSAGVEVSGRLLRVTRFASAGSGTWIPGEGTVSALIRAVGGGGSGGNSGSSAGYAGGGGGGAGGYSEKYITNVAASYSYVVGAGGASRSSTTGLAGLTGGQTTISTLVAGGGSGGQRGTTVSSRGGNGGSASGGDSNLTGGDGHAGSHYTSNFGSAGNGGGSMFHSGGSGVGIQEGNPGRPGYRGSGGGGSSTGASGAGGAGYIEIWEYS